MVMEANYYTLFERKGFFENLSNGEKPKPVLRKKVQTRKRLISIAACSNVDEFSARIGDKGVAVKRRYISLKEKTNVIIFHKEEDIAETLLARKFRQKLSGFQNYFYGITIVPYGILPIAEISTYLKQDVLLVFPNSLYDNYRIDKLDEATTRIAQALKFEDLGDLL